MTIHRRQLLRLSAAALALPATSRLAFADTYPSRTVKILVATSAGGGTDIVARFIAQWQIGRASCRERV